MGVHDLMKILKKYKVCINFDELENKIIGIDLSNYIYRYSYMENNSYLSLLNMIFRIINNNSYPYIFLDAKPPDEKKDTIQQRKDLREKNPAIVTLKENEINNFLKIIKILGIITVEMDGIEAEALISYYNKIGVVDYILSNDSDCFPCGGKNIIMNYKNNNSQVDYYDTSLIKLTREQIINLSILLGNDFNKRIKGQGPKTSYKTIKNNEFNEVCPIEIKNIGYKLFLNDLDKMIPNPVKISCIEPELDLIENKLVDNIDEITNIIHEQYPGDNKNSIKYRLLRLV